MKKILKLVSLVMALCLTINFTSVQGLQAATDGGRSLTVEIPELGLDHYHYQYIIYDSWDGGYCGGIRLRNDESFATITNWYIQFDLDNEITDIWNAEIISHVGNTYTIKYLGYNRNIQPASSTYIGFNANGTAEKITGNVIVYGEITSK